MSRSPFDGKATLDDLARIRLERRFGRDVAAWMLREMRRTLTAARNGRVYNPSDEELAKMLLPHIESAAILGADAGMLPLIEMNMDFDRHLVNQAAVDFAREHVYTTGYDKGLTYAINDTTRKVINKEVSAWIAEPGHKLDDLARRLAPTFGRDRAKTVAITEVTNAYAGGAIQSWREINRQMGTTVITAKAWRTVSDERTCPICAPLGGLILEGSVTVAQSADTQEGKAQVTGLGDVFTHPGGGGLADKFKGQVFYRPPAHPRCRCWIVPVVEELPAWPTS